MRGFLKKSKESLIRSVGRYEIYFSLFVSTIIVLLLLSEALSVNADSISMSVDGLLELIVIVLYLMLSFLGVAYLIASSIFTLKCGGSAIRVLFIHRKRILSFFPILSRSIIGIGLLMGYSVGIFMVTAALDHNPQGEFYNRFEGYSWIHLMQIFISWSFVVSIMVTVVSLVIIQLFRLLTHRKQSA